LNNAAQATIDSELATGVTLPLAEFPPDSETEGSPSPPIVLAQAAPAAGRAAGNAPQGQGQGGNNQGQGGNNNGLPPLGSALDYPYSLVPSVPGGGPINGPAWEIDGRLNLTETGTDNVGLSHGSRGADLISELARALALLPIRRVSRVF
jgi:hypothetical protein